MSDGKALRPVEPEERARAIWYGVVSRLFYAPPDRELLEALGAPSEVSTEEGDSAFVHALRGLQRACTEADPEAVREEFESLFVGVGKAPVTPYTSGYALPHAPDRFLLALRERLAELGLARRDRVFEAEDHVAAICDTMRWHIEQGRSLEEQRAFFESFVEAGVVGFCNAAAAMPLAAFYRPVAEFAQAFLAVERHAFDMHVPA